MRLEALMFVFDAHEAAVSARDILDGKTFEDYESELVLRLATERLFMIIGEAMYQADRLEPLLAEQVEDLPQMIGMRHVLVHGYRHVKNPKVWDVVENHLGRLIDDLAKILEENPP